MTVTFHGIDQGKARELAVKMIGAQYQYFIQLCRQEGVGADYIPSHDLFLKGMDMSLNALRQKRQPVLTFYDVLLCVACFVKFLAKYQVEQGDMEALLKAVEQNMQKIFGLIIQSN